MVKDPETGKNKYLKINPYIDKNGFFYIPKILLEKIVNIPEIETEMDLRNTVFFMNFLYTRTFIKNDVKDHTMKYKFHKDNFPKESTFALGAKHIMYNNLRVVINSLLLNDVIRKVGGYNVGKTNYSYRIIFDSNNDKKDITESYNKMMNKKEENEKKGEKTARIRYSSSYRGPIKCKTITSKETLKNYLINALEQDKNNGDNHLIRLNVKHFFAMTKKAETFIKRCLQPMVDHTKEQQEMLDHYTEITSKLQINHDKFRETVSKLTETQQNNVGEPYIYSENISVSENVYYSHVWQTLPHTINTIPVIYGKSGRLYSVLTNLKKELRESLIYPTDMEKWDIKNSQYYFFLIYCLENGYEIEQELFDSINSGNYYELIYNKTTGKDGKDVSSGENRTKWKKEAMMTLTDNKVGRWQTYRITQTIKEHYPLFYNILKKIKEENISLASKMQKIETQVCANFAKKHNGFTLHDCLIIPTCDSKQCITDIKEYFNSYNIDLKIEKE